MTWTTPADVAWTVDVSDEGAPRVLLARVPDGPPVVLAGSAVPIWLSALECRDADEVAAQVGDLTGEPAETIRPPIAALLDDLVARGLLTTPA